MSRILVVLPSWVGDTVMAEPALRALRAARPSARIVTFGRPGLAQLLEGTRVADGSIEHAMRGMLGPLAGARAAGRADGEGGPWDEILLLPNSARSALLARLIPARRRIGFATDGRAWLLRERVPAPPRDPPMPAVDWYATLVERAFDVRVSDRRPRLAATLGQRAAADSIVGGLEGPIVLLNPGANRPDKRWPAERFAAVGLHLRGRGCAILVNGSPAEAALVAGIASACGGVDLAARRAEGGAAPGLGRLLGVLERCALLVTNDTGPRHLGLGLGVPTISLFGPTDPRWTTIPGAPERRLLGEPFLPEDAVADRHPRMCRIDRVEVEDVIASAAALLA